jgi:DNA-binding transcriptional MerR regulator
MFADVKTLHDLGRSLAEIQKTLKNASILSGKGSVEVDASIEFREKKQERVVREQAEMQEGHLRLNQALLSNRPDLALASRPTEPGPRMRSLYPDIVDLGNLTTEGA